MKTFNLVLLFALSAVSSSAMSAVDVASPEMDAGFIQTVKKIAVDHKFVVQEYNGVVSGMNDRGFYFVAKQEDQSWEITPADTWVNAKVNGTTTQDFESEVSKISQQ